MLEKLLREGELRAYKRGHRYYVLYGDLVAFITRRQRIGSKVKENEKGENE
jgi:hypothetical protein